MKIVMKKKDDDNIIRLKKLDVTKIPKGHMDYQSGAGQHQDKRTRRNKTRRNQVMKSISEWE